MLGREGGEGAQAKYLVGRLFCRSFPVVQQQLDSSPLLAGHPWGEGSRHLEAARPARQESIHLGTVVRMTKWVRKNPWKAVGLGSNTQLQTGLVHMLVVRTLEQSTSSSQAG